METVPARMNENQARQRIEELRTEVRRHDILYYGGDRPQISDEVYDELFSELKALEGDFPELVTSDSPTQRVAGTPLSKFETVDHEAPMLSLDSAQDPEALRRFDERIRKALGDDRELRYVVEPKLDGLSIELVFEDGRFVRASTRGDGVRGEDVTANVRTIRSIPLRLRDDGPPVPPRLSVRGEVIIRSREFAELNERLMNEGREPFANPRNSAAGSLRQLDPELAASRPLEAFVYDVLHVEGASFASQLEVRESLAAWGLRVSERVNVASDIDAVLDYFSGIEAERDDLPYEIDGIVIKLDDLADREHLGSTSRHPRWAFAFKFAPRAEITRILAIAASVGRTGVVTPVALMEPVQIGGVTVSRASLHNREEVARKEVREGDLVRVQRAGDVIPQVVERIEEEGRERGREFRMPVTCPSCGTDLIDRGPFTVCPNSFGCAAQLTGRIQHFGSRQGLDVEGLGEETARLLVAEGLVKRLPDLFALTATDLVQLEGFAELSASNLISALGEASRTELRRLLYGLGIPEVGAAVAADLATHFRTIGAIRVADADALVEVPGVGRIMADRITGFFAEPHNRDNLDELLVHMTIEEVKAPQSGEFSGKSFVFTGALETLSRPEAKALVEARGARVSGSVSAKTDFVVAGESAGSKLAKAEELGLDVLSEEDFRRLLGIG